MHIVKIALSLAINLFGIVHASDQNQKQTLIFQSIPSARGYTLPKNYYMSTGVPNEKYRVSEPLVIYKPEGTGSKEKPVKSNPAKEIKVEVSKANANLIYFEIQDVSNLTLYDNNQPLDIKNFGVYAWLTESSLSIDVIPIPNQENRGVSGVTIGNPSLYKCYDISLSYSKQTDSYTSTDFNNEKTQSLYALSKQLIALWAQKNRLLLEEGNKAVEILKNRLLIYSRDLKNNQIILQLSYMPLKLKKTDNEKKTSEYILLKYVNINVIQEQKPDKLTISLDTYSNIPNITNPIVIDKANGYACYHEFSHLFNTESYFRSDDFTTTKTNRLYEFSKQLIALWAQNNNLEFTENGESIVPHTQLSRSQRWGIEGLINWLQLQQTKLSNLFSTKLGGIVRYLRDAFYTRNTKSVPRQAVVPGV